MNILMSIAATSTILVLSSYEVLDFSMMCYLIRPNSLLMWFMFFSTDTAVWLTSVHGLLQTTLPLA
ncbi:hypothetical protein OKW21_004498 [Catalinimonas alkaloidigena]|uniref:hypothetical protein n=1 Tax=Catalinimonas alkaloidigena TaxID=1075417 RepID=UPI002407134B|nr:hypothetical protein [Catalinimonas alkaloidigena]MDF9799235.1 hypothetical protein [Catalinimonas alkaloidigena]